MIGIKRRIKGNINHFSCPKLFMAKLPHDFYARDALEIAPELLGKNLVRISNGKKNSFMITEVEVYKGTEDLACHASKGKTRRTEVMFEEGGVLYIYLIYGMYWMMNIVTGKKDIPQAILIRGIETVSGPGRLTRELQIDKTFNKESLITSSRIWIEDVKRKFTYHTTPRIGIDYAGEPWISMPWRFIIHHGA